MSIAGLGRKISQLRDVGVNGAIAYVSNYLNTIENSFHRRRIHQLRAEASDLETILADVLDTSNDAVREATRAYDSTVGALGDFCSRPATADDTLTRVQYGIVRLARPDRVLETGVWWGVSSAVMLTALHENGCGHLYSVDMPPMDPERRVEIGAAVPAELRSRWTLRLGPSATVLPAMCAELGSIDVFVHDSSHTYRCMRIEFETTWPSLRTGGLLIADDIHSNDAFLEFVESVGRQPWILPRRKSGYIGLVKK
jgi:hypothetical protein